MAWVAIWLPLYRPPERARWLSETERTKILAERGSAESVATSDAVGYRGLLLETPTLWGLALTQGCINYTSYFFLAWLPGFLQSSYHLTVMQAGGYTAVPFALSVFLSIAISYGCDRILTARAIHDGMRRYAVALGALMSASIVLTPLCWFGWHRDGGADDCSYLQHVRAIHELCTRERSLALAGDVGRTYAFFTLGGISFGIIGPIVTGYLVAMTGDFKIALVLCGGLSVVAAVLVTTLTTRPLGEGRLVPRTA